MALYIKQERVGWGIGVWKWGRVWETADRLSLTYWDPTELIATRPLYASFCVSDQQPTSNISNLTSVFYCHDLTKNITVIIDPNASIVESYDYDAFGTPAITYHYDTLGITNRYSLLTNSFLFSSEYHDPELGLHYYNYRLYNPSDGRWISRDPIVERGGMNLYVFAKNNICKIDHIGLNIVNQGGSGVDYKNQTGYVKCTDECIMEPLCEGSVWGIMDSCCRAHERVHIKQLASANRWCKKTQDSRRNTCCNDSGKIATIADIDITEKQADCEAYVASYNCAMEAVKNSKNKENCIIRKNHAFFARSWLILNQCPGYKDFLAWDEKICDKLPN